MSSKTIQNVFVELARIETAAQKLLQSAPKDVLVQRAIDVLKQLCSEMEKEYGIALGGCCSLFMVSICVLRLEIKLSSVMKAKWDDSASLQRLQDAWSNDVALHRGEGTILFLYLLNNKSNVRHERSCCVHVRCARQA